ncbi:unnamed protein product [Schistocephalus solidus]|uniref:TetR_C_7 domain-containing protein n=1 Tax=Schistocephalus solidus TaxID=70667 RepID=A0A183SVK1_SCHSO|nr:unnamed protein product [Schistocephalus solidus]
MCATEDFEGILLDDISQMTLSCLNGGAIIWSMPVLQFLGYLVAEIQSQQLNLTKEDLTYLAVTYLEAFVGVEVGASSRR